MKDVCVSIPKELSTYIILVLTNDYKSYLKCKKQKYKSWYSLLLCTWSLSSSMRFGSGIYIFLASKCESCNGAEMQQRVNLKLC